jgi:CelD/BcsL family acetyltransferase involved in cellulose biosynthesis
VDLRVATDFHGAVPAEGGWDALVAGAPDLVFLTSEWQRQWWDSFGRGQLLLVVAERRGEPVAIAPLYADEGMLLLVGSGGSDYLDFIGAPDAELLGMMLEQARRRVDDFAGFGLYHLPLESSTTPMLPDVAARLGLELHREDTIGGPYIELPDADAVTRFCGRRKVRKEEARMRRAGALRVRSASGAELDEWLELLLAQHSARWRPLGVKGFEGEDASAFCRAIVHAGHRGGWLRFTMLEWRGAPAAFEITLIRGSRHLSYLVSRDPEIRSYSPGKVLEAHVVREAFEAGARCFDLGMGEEQHKLHSASGVRRVANWFLYP